MGLEIRLNNLFSKTATYSRILWHLDKWEQSIPGSLLPVLFFVSYTDSCSQMIPINVERGLLLQKNQIIKQELN